MMMKNSKRCLALTAMALSVGFSSSQVLAAEKDMMGLAVGAGIGTLGWSFHVDYDIDSVFGVGLVYNTFPTVDKRKHLFGNELAGQTLEQVAGIDQYVDSLAADWGFDLQSYGLILNWHPTESELRVSLGGFVNDNEVAIKSTKAVSASTYYSIGGKLYGGDKVGRITGTATYNDFATYLGVGYDLKVEPEFGVSFDAGAYYQGNAHVQLVSSASSAGVVSHLPQEEISINHKLNAASLWPVLKVGVYYQF